MFGKGIDELEENKKIEEKQIKEFHKSLGLKGRTTQSEINKAVLRFAKTCRGGWSEIFLNEEQKRDKKFLFALYKTNKMLVNPFYIPEAFRKDQSFVLKFLELYVQAQQSLSDNSSRAITNYQYRSMLENFQLRFEPEFLEKFAEVFPDCNLFAVISGMRSSRNTSTDAERKKCDKAALNISRQITLSQARRFGSEALKYIPSDHSNYIEAILAGIECDGFRALSCLPLEMIYENRALIAVAANSYEQKIDAVKGLKNYFENTISVIRKEVKNWCYKDVRYFPLRQAIIKDDSLFESINLPEEIKTA